MLRDNLARLVHTIDPSHDPRQMARVVMARQILNAQRSSTHLAEAVVPVALIGRR